MKTEGIYAVDRTSYREDHDCQPVNYTN